MGACISGQYVEPNLYPETIEKFKDAAAKGELDKVNEFLRKYPKGALQNHVGYAAFFHACKEAQEDVVLTLMRHGVDPNRRDRTGLTMLMHNCRSAHPDSAKICRILMYRGLANLEAKSLGDWTALMHAAAAHNHAAITVLLSGIAAPSAAASGPEGSCRSVKVKRSTLKIPANGDSFKDGNPVRADINARSENGWTALAIAINSHPDSLVAKEVISKLGGLFAAKTHKSINMHKFAFKAKRNMTVKELLAYGADPNMADKSGITPLMAACRTGDDSLVKILLAAGSTIKPVESHGNTALHFAVMAGKPLIVKSLFEKHSASFQQGLDKEAEKEVQRRRDQMAAEEAVNKRRVEEGLPLLHDEHGMQEVTPENKRSYNGSYLKGEEGLVLSMLDSETCWAAERRDQKQWLVMDLGMPKLVTGVVTKGRYGSDQWVTNFEVLTSNDGKKFGNGMEFVGNTDADTKVFSAFPTALTARFIKIRPLAWHNYISMRCEVMTSVVDLINISIGSTPEESRSYSKVYRDCPPGQDYARSCLDSPVSWCGPIPGEEAGTPVLDGKGWGTSDGKQYLTMDVGEEKMISGLITQGRADKNQFVTEFKVEYSSDNGSFKYVRNASFAGNADGSTKVVNYFVRPILARYIRIIPLNYYKHMSLRSDVLVQADPNIVTLAEQVDKVRADKHLDLLMISHQNHIGYTALHYCAYLAGDSHLAMAKIMLLDEYPLRDAIDHNLLAYLPGHGPPAPLPATSSSESLVEAGKDKSGGSSPRSPKDGSAPSGNSAFALANANQHLELVELIPPSRLDQTRMNKVTVELKAGGVHSKTLIKGTPMDGCGGSPAAAVGSPAAGGGGAGIASEGKKSLPPKWAPKYQMVRNTASDPFIEEEFAEMAAARERARLNIKLTKEGKKGMGIGALADGVSDSLGNITGGVYQGVSDVASGVLGGANQILHGDIFGGIGTGVKGVFHGVSHVGEGVLGGVKDIGKGAIGEVSDIGFEIGDSKIGKGISRGVQNIGKGAGKHISNVGTGFVGLFSSKKGKDGSRTDSPLAAGAGDGDDTLDSPDAPAPSYSNNEDEHEDEVDDRVPDVMPEKPVSRTEASARAAKKAAAKAEVAARAEAAAQAALRSAEISKGLDQPTIPHTPIPEPPSFHITPASASSSTPSHKMHMSALEQELERAEQEQEARLLKKAGKSLPSSAASTPAPKAASAATSGSAVGSSVGFTPAHHVSQLNSSGPSPSPAIVLTPAGMDILEQAEHEQMQRQLKSRPITAPATPATPNAETPTKPAPALAPVAPETLTVFDLTTSPPIETQAETSPKPDAEPESVPVLELEHVPGGEAQAEPEEKAAKPELHKGIMLKKGDWLGQMKKRVFVLEDGLLRYYAQETDKYPYGAQLKGTISLTTGIRIYTKDFPETEQGGVLSDGAVDPHAEHAKKERPKTAARRGSVLQAIQQRKSAEDLDETSLLVVRLDTNDRDILKCKTTAEVHGWVAAIQTHLDYWKTRR